MARAATLFLLLVAALSAGAVFAQSVTTVRAVRSQTVLAGRGSRLVGGRVPGGVGSIEEAVGQEAKVALYPGRPILVSQIHPPALVERNAVVRMSFASGPLQIVTEGRALERGAAGDPVRVMNLASRQTVTGTVSPDGSMRVGP